MSVWQQFRDIGIPRCSSNELACGHGLIWPWQEWVCEIEDWPQHHDCYHVHLARMAAWIREDEAQTGERRHDDMYDSCRWCEWRPPNP